MGNHQRHRQSTTPYQATEALATQVVAQSEVLLSGGEYEARVSHTGGPTQAYYAAWTQHLPWVYTPNFGDLQSALNALDAAYREALTGPTALRPHRTDEDRTTEREAVLRIIEQRLNARHPGRARLS